MRLLWILRASLYSQKSQRSMCDVLDQLRAKVDLDDGHKQQHGQTFGSNARI